MATDWDRSRRKAEATKRKWDQRIVEMQQQIAALVEKVPRGYIGGVDYHEGSLSDQIIQEQVRLGLREDNREGLSIGQKAMLRDAGQQLLNKRQYSDAVIGQDGHPYRRGMGGAWVDISKYPDLPTTDDFEATEKMERRLGKTLKTLWPQYYAQYVLDDPADVQLAVTALFQSGMTPHDLEAIASDPNALREAFGHIHDATVEINWRREQASNGNGQPEPDNRAVGLNDGSRAGGGTAYKPQEPEQLGSVSADLVVLQRKSGHRR